MRAPLFFQAVAIGFAIAAPVGPIGLLCIQRTLIKGYAVGLLTGLGAATADAMYGTVGAFGLSAATQWLVDSQVILRLFGGLFLILLGLKGIFLRSSRSHSFDKSPSPESNYEGSNITKPAVPELRQWVSQQNLLGAYLSTFVLTLSNPLTILSFVALFASVGLEEPSQNVLTASVFVGGVFLGSAIWWFFLSACVAVFRVRLSLPLLRGVDVCSGIAIASFGLLAIVSGINAIVS
ncbi:MAG: LysE family transporter [Synechococcus sp.]